MKSWFARRAGFARICGFATRNVKLLLSGVSRLTGWGSGGLWAVERRCETGSSIENYYLEVLGRLAQLTFFVTGPEGASLDWGHGSSTDSKQTSELKIHTAVPR